MCPVSCGHSVGTGTLLFISPIGDIYVFASYIGVIDTFYGTRCLGSFLVPHIRAV
jgi:hypothetical protein